MKLTSLPYHKNSPACFELIFILTVWHGVALADKPVHVRKPAIDINTPLAKSFVFISTQQQYEAIQKVELASVQTTYNYRIDWPKWHKDEAQIVSSFQKFEAIGNKPLKIITDSIQQHNYLVVGSKVSAPLINGIYAYLTYHPDESTPQDNSRQLSFGGRLEF